jgi:TPR repeat protein
LILKGYSSQGCHASESWHLSRVSAIFRNAGLPACEIPAFAGMTMLFLCSAIAAPEEVFNYGWTQMNTDKRYSVILAALALVFLSGCINTTCINGTWTPMSYGMSTADGHAYTPETAQALKKDSDLESAAAQFSLGYAFGRGNEKPDWNEAAKWYRKAAEKGHHHAQKELGRLYEFGLGVEKNTAEALFWLKATGFKDCGQTRRLVNTLSREEVESVEKRLYDAGWMLVTERLVVD